MDIIALKISSQLGFSSPYVIIYFSGMLRTFLFIIVSTVRTRILKYLLTIYRLTDVVALLL